MKRIIITLILLLFPLACFAQNVTTQLNQGLGDGPLHFTIETDKKRYESGENIKLEARIENKTNNEIILIWCRNEPAVSLEEHMILVETCKYSNPSIELLSIAGNNLITKILNLDLSNFKAGLYNLKLRYNFPSINLNFLPQPNQIIFKQTALSNSLEIELVQSH